MYGLMVAFESKRATPVSGGRNEGLNFGNVAVEYKTTGDRYHGSVGGIRRKLECWRCGGEHVKRDCPKGGEEKGKKKDDDVVNNKCAKVTGGQLHTMFTS